MEIPRSVRRKLRRGLGSRTQRRSGVKSRIVPTRGNRPEMPSTRLKRAIKRWKQEQVNAT